MNIGARAPQQVGVRNGPQHTALSQRCLHGSSWCVRGERRLQGNPSFSTPRGQGAGTAAGASPFPRPRMRAAARTGCAPWGSQGAHRPWSPRDSPQRRLTSWECIEGKTHHPRPSRPGRDHAVGRGPISTLKSRQNTVCGAQGAGRPERGQNPGWRRGRHARSQASGCQPRPGPKGEAKLKAPRRGAGAAGDGPTTCPAPGGGGQSARRPCS